MPRTAHFMGSTAMRGRGDPVDLPVPALSPGFAAHVAMDELILALAMGPNRFPVQADFDRVAAELAHARLLYDARGWLDDPASYHRAPPPLTEPSFDRGKFLGTSYERLLFPSGWEPRDDEPGAARWNGYTANRTASATILRHPGPPRPWVVAIHGFGMGFPFMDLTGLHAGHLHRDLGLNVAMPVLPLHGARRITRVSGEAFLSFDLINTVHGLAQSVWDIRRLIGWVHAQDAPQVALYGVSLGGYIASLLAGLVDDVDAVIAGVPVVDFPAMFHHQAPHRVRLRAVEHEILDGNAELVHRVVSPLAFAPRVPQGRRFIFAGLGDRMAPPDQALALWRHWDEPEISWYAGNHVGYLWSRQVTSFLNDSLAASDMVVTEPEPEPGSGPTPRTPARTRRRGAPVKEDAPPVPEVGAARDPAFLRAARPILELYTRYFRSEVRGWEHVPDEGPFLVVGNHSGGQAPPDIPVLLTAWWRERGDEEPIYALFHSFFLALPGMGSLMAKAGAIEAGNEGAEAILEGGNILIVYPGGDHEVFRPWSERNRIDFGGRRGLVRLALRTQVPVVPAVTVGAHETLVVLTRGEAVARFLRLDRLFRVKVWPVAFGPPFGLAPGGMPTFPLPAKITVELLEPIDWSTAYGPEAAEDDDVVTACYDELVGVMQDALDRLAAERRFPVIG